MRIWGGVYDTFFAFPRLATAQDVIDLAHKPFSRLRLCLVLILGFIATQLIQEVHGVWWEIELWNPAAFTALYIILTKLNDVSIQRMPTIKIIDNHPGTCLSPVQSMTIRTPDHAEVTARSGFM